MILTPWWASLVALPARSSAGGQHLRRWAAGRRQIVEIETELSVHASQLRLPTAEFILPYSKREEGSASKLRTIRDGARILRTFALLLKETRPALFFGSLAATTMLAAIVLAAPVFATYAKTGLAPRLPTVVLCTGLTLCAALMGVCGLILDLLARARVEQKRILYVAMAAPRG